MNKTSTIAAAGEAVDVVWEKYADPGKSLSLIKANVIRPVTVTLANPAKNKLITMSHVRPAPPFLPQEMDFQVGCS